MAEVAFIGLGVMGYPMAGHLSRAGHTVRVFNRTRSTRERWLKDYSGIAADTAGDAARDAEFVFCCVGNDHDVRAVILGEDGALAQMRAATVLIDHTTTSANLAVEIGERATVSGVGFLDAPVSGGQIGAQGGTLTVMCGGVEDTFERVRPTIEAYARTCVLMGDTGSGQSTKMVNQICIAGLLQGLAEGMNFGLAAGLDMEKVVAVISKGAAQSWQMDNRAASMVAGEFDFGFAVDWMRKDLGIALDAARANGAGLPVAALVDQLYAELQRRGERRADTSSLIKLLRDFG
ncbi:MAG: NAD(P)-dependent oxidoreductase [Gammaproteobacteria bacterium]|jgi:3-hydroxyisobutyrate dehydrogenase-like beta-hydroxyacid dehydrogenase